METQLQQDYQQQQEYINADSTSGAVVLQNPPVEAPSKSELQDMGGKISEFLANLPDYTSRFFQEYKLPLLSFALLVVAIISLRVIVAVLNAFNGIPLVQPLFELIGMGYTVWFTSRYLLKESNRKELAAEIDEMKKQILGTSVSG